MQEFEIKIMKFIQLAVAAAGALTMAVNADSTPDDPADYKATILITGSNRGIGYEFVRRFSERDWRIIATARNPDEATDLHALADADPDIIIEQLDVTDHPRIDELAAKYQAQPIDILLLNAAIGPAGIQTLAKLEFDRARLSYEVNVIGPMKITQAFMEHVQASQKKQVIAMSSDSGSFVAGSQRPILWHYKASKAALNMYFHTLAFETQKRGVTAIMLHPGLVGTNPQLAKFPGAIKTEDSVNQMLQVLDKLTLEDNGRFISYQGETMPW
jgi:NAD(P)-dependent dehydrogenase (short-subunit alcohol dehydrogenase family)